MGTVDVPSLDPEVGAFAARIRDEEGRLVAEFGEAYRDCQRRTERLIPFLY